MKTNNMAINNQDELSRDKLMSHIQKIDTFYNYDELIEQAIEDERQGYLLYTDLSQKMKSKQSREAFELLANEELFHMETLEKYLNNGPSSFRLPKYDFEEEIVIEDIKLDTDSDLREILLFAINEEKKAYKHYKDLAKMSDDKDIHDTFVQLSRFELTHLMRLEKIYRTNYFN